MAIQNLILPVQFLAVRPAETPDKCLACSRPVRPSFYGAGWVVVTGVIPARLKIMRLIDTSCFYLCMDHKNT
jgi:hypothetical protein